MNNPTIHKGLKYTIISILALALFTPLIVNMTLYFPYITGKAFYMRSVILLALVFYAVLITVDKTSRPKKSTLMFSVIGFLLVLGAATTQSVDPSRSFWSNFERMEGLVTLLYMGTLFLIAGSVVGKKGWVWLMNISLAVSVWVGAVALKDLSTFAEGTAARISGTLGNSSYLGVYALIHVFFAILAIFMLYRGNREAELLKAGEHAHSHKLTATTKTHISIYILLALFNLFVLFETGTRGSFLGLLIGLLITSTFLAFKEKNKVLRYGSIGILIAVFLFVAFLGFFKQNSIIKDSPTLNRFGSLVTFDVKSVLENQGQARVVLWKMAYKGVQEKPLLGWGQDTFGYVFAKYYDPNMYAQEQWFDRSHNVFLDWLVAAGALGLIGYLLLFVFALVCLFSKKAQMTVIEKSVFLGLFAAYFTHNLFVFDNLSSYVIFFLLLAYIHSRYAHTDQAHVDAHKKNNPSVDTGTLIIASGFVAVLVASYVGYKTIYEPYVQNKTLIAAMMVASDQTKITKEQSQKITKTPADIALEDLKKVFTLGHTGEAEAFEQLTSISLNMFRLETVSDATKLGFFNLFQERVAYHDANNSGDPRYPYFISTLYSNIGSADLALQYAKKAYDLSPTKQTFAYPLASIALQKNNVAEALVYLKKAYEDAPKNENAFNYYVSVLLEAARSGKNTYNTAKLMTVAEVVAEGYQKEGHTLITNPKFWELLKVGGKSIYTQQLAARLIILVPNKKTEIQTLSK